MKKKKRTLIWYSVQDPWIFLIPTLLGLFIFRLIPIGASLYIGFTRWNLLAAPKFIGWKNYIEMFQSANFQKVLVNTLLFSAVYLAGIMVFGLFLAVLLNRKMKGISFFRAAFYTPVVTSAVAVGIVWAWILSPKYGILPIFLQKLHITSPYWLSDPKLALFTVAIVQVWKMAGYYMILYLAGLQQIPENLHEAALIDGASRRKVFTKITLPLLSPTTFFILIVGIIDSFKNFELIYVMTKGGPLNATNTLVYDVFLNAFSYYRMGYASSVAYVLFAIVGAITILNFYGKKRWVQYQY